MDSASDFRSRIRTAALTVVAALFTTGAAAGPLNLTLTEPLVSFNGTGELTYDSIRDLLLMEAEPSAIKFEGLPPIFLEDPRGIVVAATIDEAGTLIGGTLLLTGTVDLGGGDIRSGTLLVGKANRFGFEDDGATTAAFDFVFRVTGGQLREFYELVGVEITSENSNFVDFTQDSAGGAKGTLGNLPKPVRPARLGDRLWEDRNGNGIQDCEDTNGDGIIGNPGDVGPECDAGIPGVPVELLLTGPDETCGTGDETVIRETVTGPGGFYAFAPLVPGVHYCVRFSKPGDDFCAAGGFDLGAPQFTEEGVGADDDVDSDADPQTGQSGNVTLRSGERDLSIDAGIVCPVKLGDLVWEDDGDGIRQPGEPEIEGVVVELRGCGPDMIAGTADDVITGEFRTTGPDGMYMFGGEPGFTLPPDKYYVIFDPATYPDGYSITLPKVGGDDAVDSDCRAPTGITACTDLTASRAINLDRDCGLVPPPEPVCELTLDKTCRIDTPPVQFDKCNGKLTQFTLEWGGAGPITATGPNNSVSVNPGEEATFFGPFDNNDVIVDIVGAVTGQSEFHVSCSDEDFNDPTDCGKPAGDGKSNEAQFINDWFLAGFVDADGLVLDCTPDGGAFADNCSAVLPPRPSCETTGKPDTLTWVYDGGSGSCADSTFDVQQDFECIGSVDETLPVTVTSKDGTVLLVDPGQAFDLTLSESEEITLTNSGGTQDLVFHVSCSQPIEAGLTAGALTLSALDGQTGGVAVTYRYEVSNPGDPLSDVFVTDDLLGDIGGPIDLDTGGSALFETSTTLLGTTVNIGTATGRLADGSACSPNSASDMVTVEVLAPTCEITIELDKIENKKIKWDLANLSNIDATIDTVVISWPGTTLLKKVKLEGAEIQKDLFLTSPAMLPVGGWLKDVKDRTVEGGDADRTLEFEFTEDFPLGDGQPASDFTLEVVFEQGCSIAF